MKKSILVIGSLFIMNVLFVGCSLGDESNCPNDLTGALSAIESDFAGTWALTGMVAEDEVDITDDDVDNPSTEIYSQLPGCQQDVVYNFNSDRSFIIEQAYNVPNCPNKATVEGTWSLSGNQLNLVAQCQTQVYAIVINTEGTLFTIDDNYNFNDQSGVIISSGVTLTYEKM